MLKKCKGHIIFLTVRMIILHNVGNTLYECFQNLNFKKLYVKIKFSI